MSPAPPSRRRRWGRRVVVASLTYVAVMLGAIVALRFAADRLWPASLLAFGPRWPILVPAIALAVAAWLVRRRHVALALVAATALTTILYLDLRLHIAPGDGDTASEGIALRIATVNAQGRRPADPWFEGVLARLDADATLVTECRGEVKGESFHGWHYRGVYGLCLFSRHPIGTVAARDPADAWAREGSAVVGRFTLSVDGAPITLAGIHLETVRDGVEGLLAGDIGAMRDNIELRIWESRVTRRWIDQGRAPLVIAGDFNLPQESQIYQRFWSDLPNAFARCGAGLGHTKQTRWFGVRIDHVLLKPGVGCVDARVVEVEGTDHDALVTDLTLPPPDVEDVPPPHQAARPE